MKVCLVVFSTLLSTVLIWSTVLADDQDSSVALYTFSVAPYRPIPKLEADFAHYLAEVNKTSPYRVSLKLALNSVKYFELIKKQIPDFALINPFDSVPAQDKYGYVPLLARPLHRCKIVTPMASKIKSVQDLKNKRVGFASKRSPISFYSERTLEKYGLLAERDYKKINYSSPFSCMHNLIIGEVDACTGGQHTVKSFRNTRNIEFIELAQCEAFPGMVFMAHERVPQKHLLHMKTLFIKWQSKNADKPGHKHQKFGPYIANDYVIIRKHYRQWLHDQ